MTTTFASRLVGADGRNLRFFVTVQGVRNLFHDARDAPPSGLFDSARTRIACLEIPTTDRRELSVVERRMKGGGVTLEMQDDDDGTLLELFTPRRRRSTYVAQTAAVGDTTIVADAIIEDSFSALGGDFYVGRETIRYTNTTFNVNFNGCTRGAYGSEAFKMRGDATNGQAIYSSPPSWIGRIVTLYGYFLNQDGSSPTDPAMTAVLGTYEIDSPPRFLGDGRWQIKGIDRIDSYMRRAIYLGVPDAGSGGFKPPRGRPSNSGNNGEITTGNLITSGLGLGQALWGQAAISGDPGDHAFVVAKSKVTPAILVYRGMPLSATYPQTIPDPDFNENLDVIRNGGGRADLVERRADIVRPPIVDRDRGMQDTFSSISSFIYLLDQADFVMLAILTSRLGDGTNGSRDVLLGNNPSSNEDLDDPIWRLGAGIAASDVDIASFVNEGEEIDWCFTLMDPLTAGEALNEFCFVTESFVKTNLEGQLSVKAVSNTSTNTVATIDADVVIGKALAEYDEDNVYPSVVLECDYSVIEKTFKSRIEVLDNELVDRYPTNNNTLNLKMRTVRSNGGHPEDVSLGLAALADIKDKMRRFQSDEGGRGALHVTVTCHLDVARLDIGDIVSVSLPEAPDMEGGFIVNRIARVISVLQNWVDGTVELKLQMLRDSSKRISPAAIIASAAGAVLTLQTTGPECTTDSLPSNMFSGGASGQVLVWDVSGNVKNARTIIAFTGTTITLDSALTFAVQNGVDFVTLEALSLSTDEPTQNGYNVKHDFATQVRDNENQRVIDLGEGVGADESRWR